MTCHLLGQVVGHWAHQRLSPRQVVAIVLALLSLSASILLGRGTMAWSCVAMAGMVCCATAMWGAMHAKRWCVDAAAGDAPRQQHGQASTAHGPVRTSAAIVV